MTEDKEKHLLEKISSFLEKGDLDACVEEAIAWAKELGISPQRLLEWSKIQLDGKHYKQAYVLALAAAGGLDEKAPAYTNAGVASYYLNDLETAEKQYRQAIKSDPNLAGAHINLGNLLDHLGRKDEAEEQYRLAIKSDPNLAAAYNNLGVLLYHLGRKAEAEKQYRQAIKSDPNLAAAYFNLGILLDDLGRKAEAEEQYRQAIKSDHNFAEAHNNYANSLRDRERYAEAEKEVRIALDLDPQNPCYLGTLGDILADDRWMEESEREYKRALEHSDEMKDSAKSEIHNNLGWVYAQKKLYKHAKGEFLKARTIDPKNIKAIRNLRMIEKIKSPREITLDKISIFFLLVLLLFLLSLSIYFFWIAKLTETSFTALLMFFTATILFVLLNRGKGRFSAGLKGVEFEMSTEHRLSPAQSAEQIPKFER